MSFRFAPKITRKHIVDGNQLLVAAGVQTSIDIIESKDAPNPAIPDEVQSDTKVYGVLYDIEANGAANGVYHWMIYKQKSGDASPPNPNGAGNQAEAIKANILLQGRMITANSVSMRKWTGYLRLPPKMNLFRSGDKLLFVFFSSVISNTVENFIYKEQV